MRLALLLLLALPAACDSSGPLDCGHYTYDGECPTGADRGLACLSHALETCREATLAQSFVTDEGGVILEELVVTPDCTLRRILDTRDDPWSEMRVEESSCNDPSVTSPTTASCERVVCGEP